MKKIKKSFTLIEILISLTLLTLIGGVFAVKGKKLFDHYLFNQEIKKFKNEIGLASDFASCYRVDVEMRTRSSNNLMEIDFHVDDPYLQKEDFFLKKRKYKTFLECLCEKEIVFSSSGWVIPDRDIIVKSRSNRKAKIKVMESLSKKGSH